MTFTVTWKPSVKRRLAEIWLEAKNKHEVTQAADAIDRLLRQMPLRLGESRSGDLRIVVLRPLVVLYEVFEDDCRVDVLSVRNAPQHPSDSTHP